MSSAVDKNYIKIMSCGLLNDAWDLERNEQTIRFKYNSVSSTVALETQLILLILIELKYKYKFLK
jgi:hypothetical protein